MVRVVDVEEGREVRRGTRRVEGYLLGVYARPREAAEKTFKVDA